MLKFLTTVIVVSVSLQFASVAAAKNTPQKKWSRIPARLQSLIPRAFYWSRLNQCRCLKQEFDFSSEVQERKLGAKRWHLGLAWLVAKVWAGHGTNQVTVDRGEPIKKEGDGKSPAGIFSMGDPFGYKAKPLSNFLTIRKNKTACVDDVKSKYYNKIVDRKSISSTTSHEKMWRIKLYRNGLFVDHKTSRKKERRFLYFHPYLALSQQTHGGMRRIWR